MAIRTLTEFSGTLIRMAAKAEAEAKKSLPKEVAAVAAAPAPTEVEVTAQPGQHAQGAGEVPHAEPDAEASEAGANAPDEKSASGAFSSATDAVDELAAKEKAAEEESHPAKAEPAEAGETDAVKAILDEAVAKATGTSGDRLARLREAVHAAKRSFDRVRLVRVFGGEESVAGATKIGEHQYLVDLMPHSMKQVYKDPKDEKGKSRGPKRPSGSTKNKNDASLEGSFSMESVAQDRKAERSLPGARRPGGPGGGRPGGNRPGGPGGGRGGRPGGNGPPRGGRTSGAPKP